VFLERTTKEEWADTFGGQGAPQNVVAAIDEDAAPATREAAEATIRTIYAPVIDVHWVTVKQLAILEPTLVETIFDDSELDGVIAKMLKLDALKR
jgi:hypothetical protein